jgi:hypothetical protein
VSRFAGHYLPTRALQRAERLHARFLSNFLAVAVVSQGVHVRAFAAASLALAALAGATLAPASALGAPADASTTEAYLRANYALVVNGNGNIPRSEALLRGLRERLRRECGGIVIGSPQEENSNKLTWEAIGAMTIAGYQPGRRAIATFARAVAPLRWSNAALTRAVRSYARKLRTEVQTPPPDVCGDLRAWRASGYTSLPQSTLHFRATFYTVYVGIGFLPLHLLGPSLPASQSGVVRRTQQLELRIAEAEARAVETYGEIVDSLGLNQ